MNNRIIKFRAWSEEYKRMFDGDEIVGPKHILGATISGQSAYQLNHFFKTLPLQKLIPMQFTGLTDKNGKDIYEGDIVEATGKNVIGQRLNGVVKYEAPEFIVDDAEGTSLRFFDFEVIGNIYENPELLADKQGE